MQKEVKKDFGFKKKEKRSEEEKEIRAQAIKNAKAQIKKVKETNLAIERADIIVADLNKFSTNAGKARLAQANEDYSRGLMYFYENAKADLKTAKKLPKSNAAEKEIRSDAIKNARVKKESAALIGKYGIDSIKAPDDAVKNGIMTREVKGFFDSIRQRQELKAYLKAVSVYTRAVKPYTDAENLISQAENYTHYEKLEEKYFDLVSDKEVQ